MKFAHIQNFFFFGVLLSVTGVFFYMLGGYLVSVLWATVIAIVFYPIFKRLERLFRGYSSLAAFTTVGGVILVVLIPFIFIGGMVVSESVGLYQNLTKSERASFESSSLLARAGQVTVYLEPYGVSQVAVESRIKKWATSLSQVVASSLVSFSQLTISFLIHTAIMLYLLFFFLRDGASLLKIIIHHLPLSDKYERQLFTRFTETTQAVVKGTIIISVIQGIIGGLLFFAVGIPNPVLWGVAMGALSVIPLFGTALIWVPASLILIFTGSVWAGLIIFVVGAVLISLVDDFIRPILVGRSAKMPDAIVLMATIGGLATFGISGFVIGPIVAALFLSLWKIFEEKYRKELVSKG